MTHVMFRSAETGRFLFGCWIKTETIEALERIAALRGITLEDVVVEAIRDYCDRWQPAA